MVEKALCGICRKGFPADDLHESELLWPSMLPILHKKSPAWNGTDAICRNCMNEARCIYVESSLIAERGELSSVEAEVIEAIRKSESIVDDPFESQKITFGQALADRVASFGGSWSFIIIFVLGMLFWILINTFVLGAESVDPYPFILLNLMLSCLAALQAPVIMMSQNRQDQKDRAHAEMDFKTNLKAELEIRHLHLKIDQLTTQQWHRLLEIQHIQTELLRDLAKKRLK